MNEREMILSSFSIFSFYLFWLFFFLFLHFRFPRCHSFFFQSQSKFVLSLLLLLFNHLSLFITSFSFVILFFLLLSLCLVLFNSFSHLSLQTFLFHSFEISFRCDIVLFSVLPLLILRFPFLKVLISFFLYSILLKHAAILIERFGQTCMTKESLC